ncbi:MAG TPA: lytic transglycosylase domain-containing protein [Bryobacteraceae bacterium]|nr:lytic transglycosylase domain-containing protein [Bryobacteraceae bacterium]
MKWQLILLAGSVSALAQSPGDFEKSVRASMAPGLAQQRASVRQQSGLVTRQPAAASAPGFFTLPPPPVTLSGSAPCDPLPDGELDPLIQSAAGKQEVDPGLVRAVIEQESAGRPCAVSAAGATGLMQLMPDTAEQLDVRDPFDPRENVEAGTRLLKSLLNRYGDDPSLALGAYNAGPTRVDQEGGVPAIPETLDYVAGILSKLKANAGKPAPAQPRN